MDKLIDVTHTVKASAAPSAGARYMFDPATNERFWVEETVPEGYFDGPPNEPLIPELTVPVTPPPEEVNPAPEPEPEPVKSKGKKLHHG